MIKNSQNRIVRKAQSNNSKYCHKNVFIVYFFCFQTQDHRCFKEHQKAEEGEELSRYLFIHFIVLTYFFINFDFIEFLESLFQVRNQSQIQLKLS